MLKDVRLKNQPKDGDVSVIRISEVPRLIVLRFA
jgi:hypothetical protein